MRRSLVLHADARALPLPDNSVDAIVCDPPYGLEFMGKDWDRFSGAVTDRNFKGFVLPSQRTRNVKCPDCNQWAYDHPGRRCECGGVRRSQMSVFQVWCEQWAAEAFRVLKPGGHLLAMGGTRTAHRLACGIEDAGFELRDRITVFGPDGEEVDAGPAPAAWLYGSGFPKSRDVAKDIDKMAGAEREATGRDGGWGPFAAGTPVCDACGKSKGSQPGNCRCDRSTAPATPEAERWQGWGTALKPAHEPIICARKPLAGTVAANVLRWRTGAINVDGCRIGYGAEQVDLDRRQVNFDRMGYSGAEQTEGVNTYKTEGRWPANVVLVHSEGCQPVGVRKVRSPVKPYERGSTVESALYGNGAGHIDQGELSHGYADPDGTETVEAWECEPGCPVFLLDQQSADQRAGRPAGAHRRHNTAEGHNRTVSMGRSSGDWMAAGHADSQGGASRFFLTVQPDAAPYFYTAKAPGQERLVINGVAHPTVKPLELMRWLVRLVTPPGGLVLDPFGGSGTTGEAAMLEGFRSVVLDNDWPSCQAAYVRTDPYVRRRRKVTIREDGQPVEQGEEMAPRLF
jgi:hypothetical protein